MDQIGRYLRYHWILSNSSPGLTQNAILLERGQCEVCCEKELDKEATLEECPNCSRYGEIVDIIGQGGKRDWVNANILYRRLFATLFSRDPISLIHVPSTCMVDHVKRNEIIHFTFFLLRMMILSKHYCPEYSVDNKHCLTRIHAKRSRKGGKG
eukprot:scaffold2193_cov179-Ochromonas_danica.AAC.12